MDPVMAAAAKALGGGVAVVVALRFIRWLVEFLFGRFDRRQGRLDMREKDIEQRFDQRLRHVEAELTQTRRAMMLLINAVAKDNPANPVLQQVADLLRESVPIAPSDTSLEALLAQAARRVEDREDKR